MAIKISALPEVTGYTVNDIVAIVDSGFLTTSKIKAGNLFNNTISRIDDQTSQDTNTFIGAGSDVNSSTTESIFQGSTKYSGVMFGVGTINNSSDSVIMGSTGGGGGVSVDNISASGIIGGFRSSMSNATRSFQIGSQDVTLSTSLNSVQIGAEGGQIQSAYKGIVIGSANCNINNTTEGFIAASRNSAMDSFGTNQVVLIGTDSCNINHVGGQSKYTMILNSTGSDLNTRGQFSASINNFNTDLSAISTEIDNLFLTNNYDSSILTTAAAAIRSVRMDNTDTSTITTSDSTGLLAQYNTKQTDISGGEGVTMISTSGRSQQHSWTLHTDNIHTFQTETFTEVNAGNVGGSVDVDCSQGSFFLFTMTADTTPNFINVRDGQRFFFIVYNNGTWSVPTATVNGVSSTVYAKNGTINPQNNSYSKYTATYDGVNNLLFLDEEVGFAAV